MNKNRLSKLEAPFLLIGALSLAFSWWAHSCLTPFQVHNDPLNSAIPWFYGVTGIMWLAAILLRDFGSSDSRCELVKQNISYITISILAMAAFCIVSGDYYLRTSSYIYVSAACALWLFSKEFAYGLIRVASISLILRSGLFISEWLSSSGADYTSFITLPTFWLSRAAGMNTVITGDGDFIYHGPLPVFMDSIKTSVSILPVMAFALIAVFLMTQGQRGIRRFTGAMLCLYMAAVARTLWLIQSAPHIEDAGMTVFERYYWSGLAIPLFVAVIIPWIYSVYGRTTLEDASSNYLPVMPFSLFYRFSGQTAEKRRLNKVLYIFGAIILAIASFQYNYIPPVPAEVNDVHFIIDEIRSDWEASTVPFDRDIGGTFGENSYWSWIRLLSAEGKVTVIADYDAADKVPEGVDFIKADEISRSLLDSMGENSVFVMKCVTEPYRKRELDAVEDWMRDGGTVFAIGDHTNVYFTSDNLNLFAHRFGVHYDDDSTYLIDGGWIVTAQPSRPLPAARWIKTFVWATNCRLLKHENYKEVDAETRLAIRSSKVSFAGAVDYTGDYFFGNGRVDRYEPFGAMDMLSVVRAGKGAMVCFTDSTCFNNYLTFTPGRRELSAGVAATAAGAVDPASLKLVLAMGFIGISIISASSAPVALIPVVMAAGLGLGSLLSGNQALPERFQPGPELLIDASHKPYHPLSWGSSEQFMADHAYDTFNMDLGRTESYFPRIKTEGNVDEYDLRKAAGLIIASPDKAYSSGEISAIEKSVSSGMLLMLIEGARADSRINSLAEEFGISFSLRSVSYPEDQLWQNPTEVKGVKPLSSGPDGILVGWKKHGKGYVVAIADSSIFERYSPAMGKLLRFALLDTIESAMVSDESGLKSVNWTKAMADPER